ncbi:aspartyl/glutamyl-tRNA(Asn/Gln) amidotransferase subunit isoform X2 [Wolffia australiana]
MGCFLACFRVKNDHNVHERPPSAVDRCGKDGAVRRSKLAALFLSEDNDSGRGNEFDQKCGRQPADEAEFQKTSDTVLQNRTDIGEEDDKLELSRPSSNDCSPMNQPLDSSPIKKEPFQTQTASFANDLTEEKIKVDFQGQDSVHELTEQITPDFRLNTISEKADCAENVDPEAPCSLTSVSVAFRFSLTGTEEPFSSPNGKEKANSINSRRLGEISNTPISKSFEADRPIIGLVAVHWKEDDDTSLVSPKLWDGNGIPNSTSKYKERVSWHATPFEERLEKALSDEKLCSQRKLGNGKPIKFYDEEGEHHY